MALNKLALTPLQEGYGVTDGLGARSIKLAGGASRFRRDYLFAPSTVECQWMLDEPDYDYFMRFYKVIGDGAEAFLVDLIMRDGVLTEHQAHFVPKSVRLVKVVGTTYWVKATLEVVPRDPDDDYDEAIVTSYEAFGTESFSAYSLLATLVNVDVPAAIKG